MKIYLATTSPRRQELLKKAGIPFEIITPSFEEGPTKLSAPDEALFFAEQKVRSVEKKCPNAWIVGSDTLIECQGKKLGKPKDKEDAAQMLAFLSGKTHNLFTAVVALNTADQTLKKHLEKVLVTFKPLTQKMIDDYIATREPFGKAGAYAVQGKGAALLEKIDGDIEAVIGLPTTPILKWFETRFPYPDT